MHKIAISWCPHKKRLTKISHLKQNFAWSCNFAQNVVRWYTPLKIAEKFFIEKDIERDRETERESTQNAHKEK